MHIFGNCVIIYPRVTSLCATKPKHPPNFQIFKTRASKSNAYDDHKNKWESTRLMDEYYVVGVTTIPYQGLAVIINIISKEDNSYHVTIGNMSQCTCLNFTKTSSGVFGKEREMYYKRVHHVFQFLYNVDYDNDKFIQAPTYTYYR
jgi:hypothetical protein